MNRPLFSFCIQQTKLKKDLTPPKKQFYPFSVLLILVAVSLYLTSKPYYNWDLFPYMALAVANSSIPFDSTHAYVYKEAALRMPPRDFAAVSKRQQQLAQSPEAFKEILKYFEIKPGYVLAVRLFHFLGFNLVTATYLPSIVSYFFIGCLLMVWMQKIFDMPFAMLTTLLIAASPFLVQTARYSSPDMLCTAILLAGIYLISESLFPVLGLLVCGLAIPFRPDSAILFGFLTLVLYLNKKLSLTYTLVFMILGGTGTFIMIGNFCLVKEFVFTTQSYSPSWGTTELIQHYLSALTGGLHSIMISHTVIIILFATMTLFLRKKSTGQILNDLWSLLIIATLSTFIVRYFLHPIVEDRFLIACYLIIIIGFCSTIRDVLHSKSNV